jgi:hypothetical protein
MNQSFNYISNHFSKRKYIFLSSLAIFAGGLIYILFRPVEPLFLNWFSAVGIESWIGTLRERSLSISSILPQWMVYSLPNGLWAFAYTSTVLFIWTGGKSLIKYLWFLSIPVLVFGFEVLQLTGNLQGTYSLIDLIWGAIGITIGLITAYIIAGQNSHHIIYDPASTYRITPDYGEFH